MASRENRKQRNFKESQAWWNRAFSLVESGLAASVSAIYRKGGRKEIKRLERAEGAK
jgi:hypothetical protein